MFAPEDLGHCKGGSPTTAQIFDIEIGQTSRHIYQLTQYNRLLRQRNEYLKQYVPGSFLTDYLDVLEPTTCEIRSACIRQTLMFIENSIAYASILHHSNFQSSRDPWHSLWVILSRERIGSVYLCSLYKSNVQEDLRASATLGIHRDDLIFYVNGNRCQPVLVPRAITNGCSCGEAHSSISLKTQPTLPDRSPWWCPLRIERIRAKVSSLDCIQDRVQNLHITTTNIARVKHEIIKHADLFHISQGVKLHE